MDALTRSPTGGTCPPDLGLLSAALFSQSLKDRYLEHFPNLIITDSIGSTESGFNGLTYAARGQGDRRRPHRQPPAQMS